MANYSTELVNAKLAANSTIIGNAGKLNIYAGTKPAAGGAAGTLLAQFTLGSPFAPVPSNRVQSPNLPAAVNAVADGTATWARVTKSDGTYVMDLTAGTSGTEVILSAASVSTGAQVSVTSWAINGGNA